MYWRFKENLIMIRFLNLSTITLILVSVSSQIIYYGSAASDSLMEKILELGLAPEISLNSWAMSEWLISYDGGFVRRGISGQLIKLISTHFVIPPPTIVIFISIVSYLILIYTIISKVSPRMPCYLLLSSLFLGLPIYSNFFFRKDISQLLLLTLALISIKMGRWFGSVCAANCLAIIAILNHEAFTFWGLPLIILSSSIYHFEKLLSIRAIGSFFPTVVISGLCFLNKGNVDIASAITNGWNTLLNSKYPEYCCLDNNPASIGAISWSIQQGLSLSRSVLREYLLGHLWVPFLWSMNLLIGIVSIGGLLFSCSRSRTNFYIISVFQTTVAMPLFALGWDFGRWIFYINSTSIIWTGLFSNRAIFRKCYRSSGHEFVFVRFLKEFPFVLLFFAVPVCCWTFTAYLSVSPLGAFWTSLVNLITLFTN